MTAVRMFTHHTRQAVMSLAVFAALTAVHTWPLASAPAHWSRVDNADAALNIWAVNWVGSHLLTDPARLFEANIFYPEHLTLAYSEVMLVQGVLAMPLVLSGASPVLAFNVALLAGLTLTGWAFCLLARRWTGSWTAGFVAGSVAAFNPQVLVRLGHLQIMHAEFFAVMLFALDRAATSRRVRDALWLGVGLGLQGLSSLYLLVFSAWMLVFAAAARVTEWIKGGAGALVRLAAAAAIATILLAPELWAYLQLRAGSGLERGAEEQIAGSWLDYLATGARVHRWWVPSEAASSVAYAFPGVTVVALVAFALSRREVRTDPRFRMCAVAAIGCVAVSMAPKLPFYPVLHAAVPLFQAVRVPARMSQVVVLLLAVLAGFGAAAWLARLAPRWTMGAAVALVILVNVEVFRAPIGFVRFDGVPAIYQVLAAERGAVVVELPFPIPSQWFLNANYMLNATAHWQPLLNGYSGFRPASYETSYAAASAFPAQESLIALHELGVTHVVVHRAALGEDRASRADRLHELQTLASQDDITIYRLR